MALKILNPVGYRLQASGPLQRCIVARKGQPLAAGAAMRPENVWWCVHPSTRVVTAAMFDSRAGQLKELPLPRCIEVWGWDPLKEGHLSSDEEDDGGGDEVCTLLECRPFLAFFFISKRPHLQAAEKARGSDSVLVEGVAEVVLPRVPPKYVRWLRARQGIYREIANMAHLGSEPHPNVVKLHEVLECVQDSKTTLFLALELVTGGELFDRIGGGTSEVV